MEESIDAASVVDGKLGQIEHFLIPEADLAW